jgi:predicted RNA binding protein YcfA (HicA-like mRNA interferase family)
MRLPRDLSGRDLAKALAKLGYETTRQTSSHIRLTTQWNGEHHITLPDHEPIRVGTSPAFLRTWLSTIGRLETGWPDCCSAASRFGGLGICDR